MLKFLNKASVKLGIISVLGIIGGCIIESLVKLLGFRRAERQSIALPLAERGIFAIPVILFPCYLIYMAMKITWELFE